MTFSGFHSAIKLQPVSRENWETCIRLEVSPRQKNFIPSNLYTIAQSKFEQITPLAILHQDRIVGLAAFGGWSGTYWITRIMIDQNEQEKGYGHAALSLLIHKIRARGDCREIRTSFHPENVIAEHLFLKQGFQRLGDFQDGEVVMKLEV